MKRVFHTILNAVLIAGLCSFILLQAGTAADITQYSFHRGEGAPFHQSDNRGQIDLIVQTALERMGAKPSFAIVPGIRALLNTNDGFADGTYSRTKEAIEKFDNLIIVDYPLLTSEIIAVAANPLVQIDSAVDLKNYSIAYRRGWKVIEDNAHLFKAVRPVKGYSDFLDLLSEGRVDLIASETRSLKRRMDEKDFFEPTLIRILTVQDVFIALHKKHADVAEKMALVLEEMERDGIIAELCPLCIASKERGRQSARHALFPMN